MPVKELGGGPRDQRGRLLQLPLQDGEVAVVRHEDAAGQAAVLFNASVPALWNQTAQAIRRQLAASLGLSQQALRRHLRVSFGKVIEYQHRGLVHVHAIIRADGPQGTSDPPPPWASTSLLRSAVLAAVTTPAITLPHPGGTGALTLRWGQQADVRIVRRDISGELDDAKVAAYIAKYAVKGTEQIGGIPVRIRAISDLDDWHVTGHVRKLITACWQLGQRPEYQSLRLAPWAHQLGYRGWFSTRSRRYSVTLGSRRDERRHTRAPHGSGSSAACRTSPASSPPIGTTPARPAPRDTPPDHDRSELFSFCYQEPSGPAAGAQCRRL